MLKADNGVFSSKGGQAGVGRGKPKIPYYLYHTMLIGIGYEIQKSLHSCFCMA